MNASQYNFSDLFLGLPKRPPLTGRQLRDGGMATVLDHTLADWKKSFADEIKRLPIGQKFTVEQIVDRIGGRPGGLHCNAIGAMTFALVKKELMQKTGVVLKTHRPERRNSDLPEWERTRGKGEQG